MSLSAWLPILLGSFLLGISETWGHGGGGKHTHGGAPSAQGESAAAPDTTTASGRALASLLSQMDSVSKDLEAGRMERLAGWVGGMRKSAAGLDPASLDPAKKNRVEAYLKNIGKAMDQMEAQASRQDLEQTRKKSRWVKAQLRLLTAQFPATPGSGKAARSAETSPKP